MKVNKLLKSRSDIYQFSVISALALNITVASAVSPQPSKINMGQKWDSQTYVAFDTETTGLSPKNSRIIEIGAVKFSEGKVIEKKNWLINPGMPIPVRSTQVHHITDEMVKDKPRFEHIYPEFESFIKGSILIAHNASFDARFISAEATRAKKSPPTNLILDSLKLFRKWYPELKSHKLALMADHHKIKGGQFHRATDDALYLIEIFKESINQVGPDMTYEELLEDASGGMNFKPYTLTP